MRRGILELLTTFAPVPRGSICGFFKGLVVPTSMTTAVAASAAVARDLHHSATGCTGRHAVDNSWRRPSERINKVRDETLKAEKDHHQTTVSSACEKRDDVVLQIALATSLPLSASSGVYRLPH